MDYKDKRSDKKAEEVGKQTSEVVMVNYVLIEIIFVEIIDSVVAVSVETWQDSKRIVENLVEHRELYGEIIVSFQGHCEIIDDCDKHDRELIVVDVVDFVLVHVGCGSAAI